MRTYKNINLQKCFAIALLSTAILTTSCKKSFLDVDPQGQQPAQDFWKTEADATKAVNAIYANLRTWENVAFPALAIESMASDEADKGSSPTDASFFDLYENFTVTTSEGSLQSFWTGQYQNITLCNQLINNIPNITMSETLKARYIAEAKFVRAYSYFRLVRAYGDVPLRLDLPSDPTKYILPRSPKSEV